MPKSIVSNIDAVLLRVSNLGIGCGFLLIAGTILLSIISAILDPNFDQNGLADASTPLIVYTIGIGSLCHILRTTLITNSSSD
ncbi:hypothetical protein V2K57_07540 [Pseudomonas alliivorans]|nr:hypothetical protein [Pseudomonas alliivorans]MEE4700250.1 hypothetical protein [Pseudomonas alliivorans]MEE4736229.1 hypothetical protein [Pseudomonas alliivorans]